MNKFFAILGIAATCSFAQSHHHSEGMHGETSTSPETKAKSEVEPIAKSLSLGIESKDSLCKYFTRYYLDVAYYGEKMTERLQESLIKQRDQHICKVLDSLVCTNYLDLVRNEFEHKASAHSGEGHHHGEIPMRKED